MGDSRKAWMTGIGFLVSAVFLGIFLWGIDCRQTWERGRHLLIRRPRADTSLTVFKTLDTGRAGEILAKPEFANRHGTVAYRGAQISHRLFV